ncbi:MAG TPA: helix-turn-helix domain-containing protein [Lysobacter sp.]|nr:helix-turn-helix domain-containing protein [Lysobacter sp.]
MSNFNSVLKGEIARVARKEIKTVADPLRKANANYRREIAELKRQVLALQKELRSLSKVPRASAPVEANTKANTRFGAKGLKSLRARLGLSAADFGRLVGASGQSIYNWEAGKTVPRASQQAVLASVRGLGKREAAKQLEALA